LPSYIPSPIRLWVTGSALLVTLTVAIYGLFSGPNSYEYIPVVANTVLAVVCAKIIVKFTLIRRANKEYINQVYMLDNLVNYFSQNGTSVLMLKTAKDTKILVVVSGKELTSKHLHWMVGIYEPHPILTLPEAIVSVRYFIRYKKFDDVRTSIDAHRINLEDGQEIEGSMLERQVISNKEFRKLSHSGINLADESDLRMLEQALRNWPTLIPSLEQ
jgi:hypothetical protein